MHEQNSWTAIEKIGLLYGIDYCNTIGYCKIIKINNYNRIIVIGLNNRILWVFTECDAIRYSCNRSANRFIWADLC